MHDRHDGLRGWDPDRPRRALTSAAEPLRGFMPPSPRMPREPASYDGAYLLDARGNDIGEVMGAEDRRVRLALGGIRDFWGFLDLSTGKEIEVTADALLFGPRRTVGWTFVALPTSQPEPRLGGGVPGAAISGRRLARSERAGPGIAPRRRRGEPVARATRTP